MMISDQHAAALQYLNGQRTAENYIDECVMRECHEADPLYHVLLNFLRNDDALRGFAACLHSWMRGEYAQGDEK